METKISIIVPVYKVEPYLRKCIESILGQSHRNLEVILVDDGSPDNCPAICDEFAAQDSRIRVIHQKNGGAASARNAALDISTGEYIGFVDSDDYILPDMYATMLAYAQQWNCGIVRAGCIQQIGDKCIDPGEGGTRILDRSQYMQAIMYDEMGSHVCFSLYRRKYWQDVRFPVGRILEDLATTFKVYHNSQEPVGVIDKPLYVYNLHSGNVSFSMTPTRNYDVFLAFRERWDFARAHYPEYAEKCLFKAADTALGTYNYYLKYPATKLADEKLKDVFGFLYSNKKLILKSPDMSAKRRVLFLGFYLSSPLYAMIIKIINRIV